MILRLFPACLLLLASTLAFGQGAVLQGGPWTPGHLPQYVGQGSGQPVISDGGAASGGAIGANAAEIGIVARGTGTPPYAGQGTGPYGTNVCDYDAPTTNATGYHYICLSANAQGAATLAVGAGGVASPIPFQFIVNGASYTFPFTGSGGGNVVGPGSSIINDIATFNATNGTLLKDSGISLGSQSANLFLATPNGSSGAPAFRGMAIGDLPISGSPLANTVPLGSGSAAAWTNIFATANPWTGLQTFDGGTASNQTLSGTLATAPYNANNFVITNNAKLGSSANFVNGWNFLYGVNAGFSGGQQAVNISLVMNGAPADFNNTNYAALQTSAVALTNLGGTSLSPQGGVFSLGTETVLFSGATFIQNATGAEFNMNAQAGSSVGLKSILMLNGSTLDAVQGTTVDTMLWMFTSSTQTGYRNAIFIDGSAGFFPISSNGYIIRIIGNVGGSTIANGVDFSDPSITITGNAFASPGFNVTGGGVVAALTGTAPSATHATPYCFSSTANYCVSFGTGAPSFAAAQSSLYLRNDGGAYVNTNGSTTWDQLASLAATQTLTNKTIAIGSNTLTGVAPLASPTFSGTVTGPDAGTWTSSGIATGQIANGSSKLTIGSSSGVIEIGSTGAFTANGAVATTMTSLGPSGSHTTIQKWLTITEADGSTVGYIPVY